MNSEKFTVNGSAITPNGAHKDSKVKDSERNDEGEGRFGYYSYRPDWMQVFNNPKFLCVLLSAFSFTQSFVVNGINNVNTTSYERRFGLPSSRVGIISSAYDISAGILVLPITYYALTGHRHCMLALAITVMGLGSFLMWLPHITTGTYEWGQGTSAVCTAGNSTSCPQANTELSYYLYVLIAGQLLHGIGGTTIYSVGISSLDDCVSTHSSPVYLGILYAFSALGPAAGYMLGGYLLDTYVDFNVVSSPPLSSTDPSWVGAWWLGFIMSMSLAWILSIPLAGLPRELPGTQAVKSVKVSEAHQDGSEEKHVGSSFREFPKVTWMLLKNPTFMLITLASASEGLVVSGLATFSPKFIQNQFGQTAGFAAILTGLMAVPGAAGGYLLGGFLCRKLDLKIRGILRLCSIACFLSGLAAAIMWARCDETKLAGLTVTYNNSNSAPPSPNLIDSCNSGCGCTQENYNPVCGANGIQYFSPCHAGCSGDPGESYQSCICINATGMSYNQTAINGVCETSCPMLYVFLPVFFITMLLTFVAATPTTMASLRCVPMSHKTFGLGVQWVFARFLGTVPGPIFFGVIIDSACLIWKRSCGSSENESCWIYDDVAMSRNFFLVAIGVKALSTTFFVIASVVYKAPHAESHQVEGSLDENDGTEYQSTGGTIPLTEASHFHKREGEKTGVDNPSLEP